MSTKEREGENPEQKEQEEYSFIQEKVVPKKRNKLKKFGIALLVTLLLAIIFGLVSSLVFYVSGNFIKDAFSRDDGKQKVVLDQDPDPGDTEPEDKPGDTKPDDTKKEDEKDGEDEEAALEDYAAAYTKLTEVAAKVNQSIVTVTGVTSGTDWFLNNSEKTNATSGLIYAENGKELLILVNRSKIIDVNEIRVTFRNLAVSVAALYDADPVTGLAVVAVPMNEINAETKESYKIADLGESYTLTTGMPILALGSPNGYLYSMEPGIITNRKSEITVVDNKLELFNTDVNDNSNGDGVIVNLEGQVVGIITSQFKKDLNKNISTAISISKVKPLLENMANQESRPYLGVVGSELTNDAAKALHVPYGIYITEVETGSPAFEAGLQRGDIITQMDDVIISNFVNFRTALTEAGPNHKMKMTIVRTTKTVDNVLDMEITLKEQKK
ncbi:S1C family serine protease [Anaerolentibacter hominis]|uniref:S1C family serine protease n=1 Tax=Anaerolentibacter hominis TaxID=3079009 RepID=UPI0031B868E6